MPLCEAKTEQLGDMFFFCLVSEQMIRNIRSEEIPEISIDKIDNVLKNVKKNRSAGPDNILAEILQEGEPELVQVLCDILYN